MERDIDEGGTRELARERRRVLVRKLLAAAATKWDDLHPETIRYLDDWARASETAMNYRTAPWDDAIVDLCKAVESEVRSCLGSKPGLEFLMTETVIGQGGKRLSRLDPGALNRLRSAGVKTGMLGELSRLIEQLAKRRGDAAHGDVVPKRPLQSDAQQVEVIAATIFKRLHAPPA